MPVTARSSDRGLWPAYAVLAAVTLGAPLAAGSVHAPVVAVMCGLSAACLLLLARGRALQRRRVAPGWAPWVMGAAAAWSFLQAVPLPVGLVRWLSPRVAELWEVMEVAPPGAWVPLSGAPLDTAVAAATLAAVACLMAVALDLGREPRHRLRLMQLAAASGGLSLAVAAAQTMAGVRGPLGLITGTQAALMTTFVNPNHGAAVLLVGLFGTSGLAMRTHDRGAQLQLAALSLACMVGVFLCGSYGALVGMMVGAALMAALAWRAVRAVRHNEPDEHLAPARRSRTLALLVLAATVPVTLAFVQGPDLTGLRQKAETALELKQHIMTEALGVVDQYAWTGLGRGAFTEVFQRHKSRPTYYEYTAPENLEVNLLLEWGVPFSVAYMLLWLVMLVRWVWRSRGVVEAAALGGMTAVWVHNQVDFNLEVLGVALPFAVLCGVARGNPPRSDSVPVEERRHHAARSARLATVAGAALLVLLPVAPLLSMEWGEAPSRAHALAATGAAAQPALSRHLRLHPTDELTALVLGRRARAARPPDLAEALRWVNRAMFLAPQWWEAHMEAGGLLWSMGHQAQAVQEYAAALRCEHPESGIALLDRLTRRGLDNDQLLAVFANMQPTDVCARLAQNGMEGRAEGCLQRLVATRPTDVAARLALAKRAYVLGELDVAEMLATEVRNMDPQEPDAVLVLARVMDARGDRLRSDELLAQAREARADPVEVDRLRLQRAMADHDLPRARRVLVELSRSLEQRHEGQAEVMLAEGRIEEEAGNNERAFVHYRNAARLRPDMTAGALGAARLATARGLRDMGLTVLRHANAQHPDPAYVEAMRRLEGRGRPKPAP